VICKLWENPHNGIWEVRTAPIHHARSKVMAWLGLDRLIKLCEQFNWKKAPLDNLNV
jgi:GH15 family glucan-1,4-alpha-glucosidase